MIRTLVSHYSKSDHYLKNNMIWGNSLAVRLPNSTATKGYDCAFCDKSTKIGTLVVLYI